MTARSHNIRRLAAAVLAAILAAPLVVLLAWTPRAAAAPASGPGTWGAGSYAYLDGRICTTTQGNTQLTTPMTSWDLGAGHAPAFLTSAITSDGSVDSSVPPLRSVGAQSVSAITAGSTGFASDEEIATYAALIGMFGSNGSAQAAQVADAVIRKASGAPAGCVDTAAEAGLLQQARQLAGPYTLTFADQPKSLLPGTPTSVSVTLTSAAGNPVAGATVSFASSRYAQLSSTTATTNSAGVATVQVEAPPGTQAKNIAIEAHASLRTGLDEVTAEGSPTSTDPSGSVATAIVVAPPTTVTGATNLTLNLSAHPVMRVFLPDPAVDLGGATDPRATVTGMYGHNANVGFTIRGPVPISPNSLCADRTLSDFGSKVAATSTLDITGDSTADAGSWQPTQPGCYWVTARLTTLDAVPKVTVHAVAQGPITVLDTSAALETTHILVKSGEAVTGRAVLRNGLGFGGQLNVVLRGPVQPPVGASTCAAVDFSSAPTAGTSTGEVRRDGATGFSIRAGGTGCFELSGAVLVRLPEGVTMRVPVDQATAPRVLAVKPSVSYAMNRIWSFPRGQVSARVTVIGTFNQPVHVALEMRRVPHANLPCRDAHYSAATSGPAGPAVAARTNLATVAVQSAPFAQPGCYEPVPVLTMDGNHAITATGSFDALTSAVAVGANPDNQQVVSGRASPPGVPNAAREIAALVAFLLLCLWAFVYAIVVARRTAR